MDPWIVDTVISELCGFLRVPAENVREDSSLLSLGLDSLKAVALSQRLKERGLLVSPVDIVKAGSVCGVIAASVTEGRQEVPSEGESGSEVEQLLRQDSPVDSIRLGVDDEVQITAATALQAGMLSQVTSVQIQIHVGHTMFTELLLDRRYLGETLYSRLHVPTPAIMSGRTLERSMENSGWGS